MQDGRAAQLEVEEHADAEAAAKKLQEYITGAAEGDISLPRAHHLIARLHSVVTDEITALIDGPVRGSGKKYMNWIRALPAELTAVIAVRECLQLCSSTTHERPVVVQDLACNIGKMIETEVRVREAERVNPLYMKKVYEQVKERCTTNRHHLRALYGAVHDRVMKGEVDSNLRTIDWLQIGRHAVQACLNAGVLEQHRGVGSKGTLVTFGLTPEIKQFLNAYGLSDVQYVTDKSQGSMACAPDDWATVGDGGYLSARRKIAYPLLNLRTIRRSERMRLMESFTAEKMPEVFSAGNYLQSMEFSIHKPTAEAIRRVWEAGGGVLGVPTKNGPTKPECPFPEEWNKKTGTPAEIEIFTDWKHHVASYYDAHREWRGHCREIGGFLRTLAKGGNQVWFPVYMDKRGRWYYRGTPNPQGSDVAKAVIHFNQKKPMGREGLYWLKVHIANSYGYDKERFDDRARWTEQHWDVIEKALDEPENHPDVFGTDAPWCMFSAAWELREAYRSGDPYSYSTGQICHMDATCSGLQHFSAMLRDPVGGRYVNLIDDVGCGPKQDIYARVAETALAAIQRDLESSSESIREMAAWWIANGISRKLAKKPVNSGRL